MLDAVVDRVAQQVHERLGQLLQHGAVERHVAALDDELGPLAHGAGEVTHDARQPLEHLGRGCGARAAHLLVQHADEASDVGRDGGNRGVRQVRDRGGEPNARRRQLARDVEQRVEACPLHAYVRRLRCLWDGRAVRRGVRRAVRPLRLWRARDLHAHLRHLARAARCVGERVAVGVRPHAHGERAVERRTEQRVGVGHAAVDGA